MRRNRNSRSPTYTENNKVELVRGGKDFFQLIQQLIDRAEACIHLQFYIFEEDEKGRLVMDRLILASKRRVQVFVVLDGYASRGISNEFIQEFVNAGVRFRWFEP